MQTFSISFRLHNSKSHRNPQHYELVARPNAPHTSSFGCGNKLDRLADYGATQLPRSLHTNGFEIFEDPWIISNDGSSKQLPQVKFCQKKTYLSF